MNDAILSMKHLNTFHKASVIEELEEYLPSKGFIVIKDEQIISVKLPDMDNESDIQVTSLALQGKACKIVYWFDSEGLVKVYNTHNLRKGMLAFVRSFIYHTKEDFIDDVKSSERALLNLPI